METDDDLTKILVYCTIFLTDLSLVFFLGGRLQFRVIVVRDVHQRASSPPADPRTNRPGNQRCPSRAHYALCCEGSRGTSHY